MTPKLYGNLKTVKEAIETQIKTDVSEGKRPADTIETLFAKLEPETVKWFFAETVKAASWDGRFSASVKSWAKTFHHPTLSAEDGKKYGQISDSIVHRAHINQLVEVIINIPPVG